MENWLTKPLERLQEELKIVFDGYKKIANSAASCIHKNKVERFRSLSSLHSRYNASCQYARCRVFCSESKTHLEYKQCTIIHLHFENIGRGSADYGCFGIVWQTEPFTIFASCAVLRSLCNFDVFHPKLRLSPKFEKTSLISATFLWHTFTITPSYYHVQFVNCKLV